jgi:DNA recombination protein RmuC
MQIALLIVCLVASFALAWLLLRGNRTAVEAELVARLESERTAAADKQAIHAAEISKNEAEIERLREKVLVLSTRTAELETRLENESKTVQEKVNILNEARQNLSDAFKSLSADALSQNNQSFLDLAKETLARTQEAAQGDLEKRQQAIVELVAPVRASLEKVDEKIQQIEQARAGAYSELREQVRSLAEGQSRLGSETGKLVTALRAPSVRGRWGEMQLRRVVEMAGMIEYCDFLTQTTVEGEDGRLRPDLVVKLPGGKSIVVDAKTPLAAYLEAIEATDEATRQSCMADHARQVRDHLQALGRKSYFEQFAQTPEFVVLFLPGESFFSAALENEPTLIEFGVERNVILATPTTLIALLRAVAYGWRQESLAENAAEISELGKELYKRIADMAGHWNRLGIGLNGAVRAYNSAAASLESRVLVSARRFEDLKTAPRGAEIVSLKPVERTVRMVFSENGNGDGNERGEKLHKNPDQEILPGLGEAEPGEPEL